MKKIMIASSTAFYNEIDKISNFLKEKNYEIIYPNGYNEDYEEYDDITKQYKLFYTMSKEKISKADELLVLNFTKTKNDKTLNNYIGPSTFLEMYEAFMNNKKIYLYTNLPDEDHILYDDIKAMNPICLNKNIEEIIND